MSLTSVGVVGSICSHSGFWIAHSVLAVFWDAWCWLGSSLFSSLQLVVTSTNDCSICCWHILRLSTSHLMISCSCLRSLGWLSSPNSPVKAAPMQPAATTDGSLLQKNTSVAESAMNVLQCRFSFLVWSGVKHVRRGRIWSRKSCGVMAERSHLSFWITKISKSWNYEICIIVLLSNMIVS